MFPDPRFIDSNGIRLAVYEQGAGAAVILIHGFPELAFSWRHQLPALADAGFHAIAPDMRGYGRTESPSGIDRYTAAEIIRDLTGLLDALQLEDAVFVGHDWGALILWQMAILAPERIKRLIILNIPHLPRTDVDPIELMRNKFGDDFYIVNFQDSDEAEQVFAQDTGHFFDVMMRKNQITRAVFDQLPDEMKVISLLRAVAAKSPGGEPLLNKDEHAYYSNAFERTGFTNPINWYRNWTKNWRALEGVEERIGIPTLFIGAADDVIISPGQIEAMRPLISDLTIEMLEPCGHWTQQERPDDVNRLIINWLRDKSG